MLIRFESAPEPKLRQVLQVPVGRILAMLVGDG